MKIRTSLRAGAKGCSPEAQYYMEQALAMEAKVQNCHANYTAATTPPAAPPVSGSAYTYPDMSGYCG
jgi:hypothetical protein